jgi:serine/threonine-protein phosphatase 5
MGSAVEQAVALKNDGNKAFAAHDWPRAIDLYTKAIELNDQDPAFYLNRAQVSPPSFHNLASQPVVLA